MANKLWTKNYTLLIVATVLGSAGGVASSFALSFLVFDETGSTLAAALLIALQLVPAFLIPLVAAPLMDRYPRKPFLVAGDAVNGVLYALAGLYLLKCEFSYAAYLGFSLLINTLGIFDGLAYNSLYPNLIPEGCEQKGYAVSGTLYPVVKVLMTPVAAVLYDAVGVGVILLAQGGLSLLAALVESRIEIREPDRSGGERFSFKRWKGDLREAWEYLRREKGIRAIYTYMSVTNGVAYGYSPILVAFFRSTPGFSLVMYSAFSVAEFAGRTIGGFLHYHVKLPKDKQFGFAFFVYQFYDLMELILLWVSYPFMLLSRVATGFLGVNSAAMREAAVQRYIPDELRAKLNAFMDMLISFSTAALGLLIGLLGEVMDYRLCVTLCALLSGTTCWLTIWRKRKYVRKIYQPEVQNSEA